MEHRGDQLTYLAAMKHVKGTDPRLGELLDECNELNSTANPLSTESVNLREWTRDYDRSRKLPTELVEKLTRETVLSREAWRKARENNDFHLFEPKLEMMVSLKREVAEKLGYQDEPYDALLDEFEPGARTSEINTILQGVKSQLLPLIAGVLDSERRPDTSLLRVPFPVEKQRAFAVEIIQSMGYSFSRGRLDITAHPFCIELGPKDIRLTTRYDENDFREGLFSIMHEAGHGLYDQNLPVEHWGTPMGDSVSLGVHEANSRLWENLVGRSYSFWEHWYPRLQQIMPAFETVSLDDFHFAINESRPSFIRTESDELTYNLHILLRFEIERALILGELEVRDLRDAWNEKFKEYFRLDVPDDNNGCLQDVHWSEGLFGYFPTYTLGNLMASQFLNRPQKNSATWMNFSAKVN